jgi:hypothetical protein
MNTTSRALLETVLGTDASLSPNERGALSRALKGEPSPFELATEDPSAPIFLTQKQTAEKLNVSRVTVWRMTKECVLHPVEILPGTWRYPYRELQTLAHGKSPAPAPVLKIAA